MFDNILSVINNTKTDNNTKLILIKALVNGVFCNLFGKIEHMFIKNIRMDKYGVFSEIEVFNGVDIYRNDLVFPISHYGLTWVSDFEEAVNLL